MIEDLLKTKKISHEQYESYLNFQLSEIGNKWFKRMLLETFMCEAPPELMTAGALAHLEGRRSIFRQIKQDIDGIETLLKEEVYD